MSRKYLVRFHILLLLIVGISVFLIGFGSGFLLKQDIFVSLLRNHIIVKKGMPEEEVIRKLGSPYQIVTRHDSLTITIHSNFMEKRKVNNKVLFYARYGYYLYVFIDTNGKVESIVFGGA